MKDDHEAINITLETLEEEHTQRALLDVTYDDVTPEVYKKNEQQKKKQDNQKGAMKLLKGQIYGSLSKPLDDEEKKKVESSESSEEWEDKKFIAARFND